MRTSHLSSLAAIIPALVLVGCMTIPIFTTTITPIGTVRADVTPSQAFIGADVPVAGLTPLRSGGYAAARVVDDSVVEVYATTRSLTPSWRSRHGFAGYVLKEGAYYNFKGEEVRGVRPVLKEMPLCRASTPSGLLCLSYRINDGDKSTEMMARLIDENDGRMLKDRIVGTYRFYSTDPETLPGVSVAFSDDSTRFMFYAPNGSSIWTATATSDLSTIVLGQHEFPKAENRTVLSAMLMRDGGRLLLTRVGARMPEVVHWPLDNTPLPIRLGLPELSRRSDSVGQIGAKFEKSGELVMFAPLHDDDELTGIVMARLDLKRDEAVFSKVVPLSESHRDALDDWEYGSMTNIHSVIPAPNGGYVLAMEDVDVDVKWYTTVPNTRNPSLPPPPTMHIAGIAFISVNDAGEVRWARHLERTALNGYWLSTIDGMQTLGASSFRGRLRSDGIYRVFYMDRLQLRLREINLDNGVVDGYRDEPLVEGGGAPDMRSAVWLDDNTVLIPWMLSMSSSGIVRVAYGN